MQASSGDSFLLVDVMEPSSDVLDASLDQLEASEDTLEPPEFGSDGESDDMGSQPLFTHLTDSVRCCDHQLYLSSVAP